MQDSNSLILKFTNCKLIRNHSIVHDDLWIRDGVIVDPEKLFFDHKVAADKVIDCGGALISPGFIDLQFNGKLKKTFSTNRDK